MDSIFIICLTLLFVFIIVQINRRYRRRSLAKMTYSQSAIHSMIKDFLPKQIFQKPRVISQSLKHTEKNVVKVIVIDDIAYWVKDSIFYTAQTRNGDILHETARPVDVENMPKNELDKMLFILDNLDRRNNNDSGSSGNE
jgi:hypothetical protein